KPFRIKVKLHVMAALDDRADNVLDRSHPPEQCGHRIDEEHGFEAAAVEHGELVAHADCALSDGTVDRLDEVVAARVAAPAHREARLVLGVDGDEQLGHGVAAASKSLDWITENGILAAQG